MDKEQQFFWYHNAFFPIVEPYLTDGASGARKNGQIYHLHNSVVNCKEEGEKSANIGNLAKMSSALSIKVFGSNKQKKVFFCQYRVLHMKLSIWLH